MVVFICELFYILDIFLEGRIIKDLYLYILMCIFNLDLFVMKFILKLVIG